MIFLFGCLLLLLLSLLECWAMKTLQNHLALVLLAGFYSIYTFTHSTCESTTLLHFKPLKIYSYFMGFIWNSLNFVQGSLSAIFVICIISFFFASPFAFIKFLFCFSCCFCSYQNLICFDVFRCIFFLFRVCIPFCLNINHDLLRNV